MEQPWNVFRPINSFVWSNEIAGLRKDCLARSGETSFPAVQRVPRLPDLMGKITVVVYKNLAAGENNSDPSETHTWNFDDNSDRTVEEFCRNRGVKQSENTLSNNPEVQTAN